MLTGILLINPISHMKTHIITFLFLTTFGISLSAHENAIAIPATNIEIDGSIDDWPEAANWYNISHYYGTPLNSGEDFEAWFSCIYDDSKHEFYIAVRVLDDEFTNNEKGFDGTQDHMLLYFDLAHRIGGGSPIYCTGADRLIQVHHKPGNFDPSNRSLDENSIEMVRGRNGNLSVYEWRIKTEKSLEPNTVFGLDFMIIDYDHSGMDEDIRLWRDGFGKSFGSQKLGDVVLVDENTEMGKIQGKIDFSELEPAERIRSIDIVSDQHPERWMKASVDSLGNFSTFLPTGTYQFNPSQHYTSPISSSGFSQNTRRFEYKNIGKFEVLANQTTNTTTIEISVLARPEISSGNVKGLPIENVSEAEIDSFITTWKNYFEIPAVSVVVIKNNKVFFDKTFGTKNNLTQESVDSRTLFEAASITKSVFATMVLRLAEREIIDLDKPLHEYLPFPNLEHDERSKLLTARIILGHQSGLPNWAWAGPGTWQDAGNIELGFTPGTEFGYSGEAFNYLGRVIEHITGKNLQTIYKQEIEKPFKLNNSYFYYTDAQEERFALGHVQQYAQVKGKERIASPASSLSTNAHLFKGFVLGLMNERGLKKSSYELIYNPYTVLKPEQKVYDPELDQHVSHGFFVQQSEHGKLIAHGGNNGDYDSKFAYNPDKKFAYIVFTNSNLGDEFIRAFEEFLLKK